MTEVYPTPIAFHGRGLSAELIRGRDGRCLFTVRRTAPAPDGAALAVILQPLDSRGLARGFSSTLFHREFSFATGPGGDARAYLWLPRNISWELATRCYYQVSYTPRQT